MHTKTTCMNRLILPALILAIIISSCHFFGGKNIRGNGVVKTENRTVGSFNSVEVGGNINVYLKQDSSSSVKVEADEDLMQYIVIEVSNNTLYIKPKDHANLKSSKGIKVYVSNPSYKNFDANGASDIYSESKITSSEDMDIDVSGASSVELDLHAPSVETELSGASNVTLRGETKNFTADGSGASQIRCFNLMTENADIEVSGASHADVFASVKLNAEASGASNIKYKGNASVTQDTNGASSIKKAD